MSKTTRRKIPLRALKGTRNVLWRIAHSSHENLGRTSYSCLCGRLLFLSGRPPVLLVFSQEAGFTKENTLPCLQSCCFVWGWHHLGTKAWPVRMWISPATGIGSRAGVWASWTNETQRWNFYWDVWRELLFTCCLCGVWAQNHWGHFCHLLGRFRLWMWAPQS